MRYFVMTVLFAATSVQAQTLPHSGFRDAVNAEQAAKGIVFDASGEYESFKREIDLYSAIFSDHDLVRKNEGKEKSVYGITLGSKSSSVSLKDEYPAKPIKSKQIIVRKRVDCEKSNIEKPKPLTKDDSSWCFVIIDVSSNTIVGVGIATDSNDIEFGKGMLRAVHSKGRSVKVEESNPEDFSFRGGEPKDRNKFDEAYGVTDEGLFIGFTDRKTSTGEDVMRLTYFDPGLVKKAFEDAFGF